MEPLPEMPSYDDLASSGVESWLDSSSKYHSCEIVDEEQQEASLTPDTFYEGDSEQCCVGELHIKRNEDCFNRTLFQTK